VKKDRVLKLVPGLYLVSPWPFEFAKPGWPKSMVPFVAWHASQKQATRLTAIQAGQAIEVLKDHRYGRHAKIVKLVPKGSLKKSV
jgi:hypothetical protein